MQDKRKGEKRLRPGELDGLVLGYMKRHKGKLPLSPAAVAQGLKRSSGAVGNCLGRLEKEKKVRLTKKKPREYDLAGSKN
jgi:predicted RNA-binding protein (virulence factor B family)